MNTYTELKQKQSKEINDFQGIFFAFSNEQFKEGMASLGLQAEDTKKIYSIGAGGYILKDRAKDFYAMLERFDSEKKELRKQEKTLVEALVYELKNHEFCITLDPNDALNALGWSAKDIEPKLLKKAMSLAV
jgi:hypothetical protein